MQNIELQRTFFQKLTAKRQIFAEQLEDPDYAGVKQTVVDKYSDQAHFIYELLQNADDVKANECRFVLTQDGLLFIHNGTVNFRVSNPEISLEKDSVGHVNSITGIGNSNKNEATIGKFGVGFKAVFQYTNTPHVYDPHFKFRIERFIVPQLIDEDHKDRKGNETLFYFPFDLPNKSREEAYSDVLYKLKSLIHPVLFLTNLEKITWEAESEKGKYTKSVKEEQHFGETLGQLIALEDTTNYQKSKKNLWLFTRKMVENAHKYSVGFFLDVHQKLDYSKDYTAFCFFPTKETTNLKFIIQAPFLLTDSREGIKAGHAHNVALIKNLSILAAESLLSLKQIGIETDNLLIDDTIIHLIPYVESDFSDWNSRNKISFQPFFSAIKAKMQNEALLPTKNKDYTSKNTAYWASDTELTELFSDEQIAELMEKPDAKWVFASFGRKQMENTHPKLVDYIDGGNEVKNIPSNLIVTNLTPEKIFRRITASFIENQSIEWLKSLYAYLLDRRNLWEKDVSILRNKPIFINKDKKAIAAFDLKNPKNLLLFLPIEMEMSYPTINEAFLSDADSIKFFEAFGIAKPKLKDEIYHNIFPLYKKGEAIDTIPHFKLFMQYFKECPNGEMFEYLDRLKQCPFVLYVQNGKIFRGVSSSKLYLPTEKLKTFFKHKPDTRLVNMERYIEVFGEEKEQEVIQFLLRLGVHELPLMHRFENEKRRKELDLSYWTQYSNIYDKYIEGSKELIANVTPETSLLLWQVLCLFIKKNSDFKHKIMGSHSYYHYSDKTELFDSEEFVSLTNTEWLYKKSNIFESVKNITVDDLADFYDVDSNEAKQLIEFLGIKRLEKTSTQEDFFKKLIEQYDATPEYIEQLLIKDRQGKTQTVVLNDKSGDFSDLNDDLADFTEGASIDKTFEKIRDKFNKQNNKPVKTDVEEPVEKDEDDFTKPSVNFEKKIAQKEEQLKAEIEELNKIQALTEAAQNAEKYSFIWFKSLLELEYLNSSENNSKGKELSIQFTKVEKEAGTERTWILKNPSRYIPQSIEDIGDLTVCLHFGGESRSISIEVVSVKEYTLRAKLNKSTDISDIDVNDITKAVVDIKNPVFILDELRKNFIKLPFEDDFDLQTNLTQDIEFIFGPPGTGKTTYLANKVLMPMMEKQEDLKVLVLTPTNKAADVLVNRIMETMGNDFSYYDWLVRFGVTSDPVIEQSPVFCDKTFDIRARKKNVTVTTIARFPYDYFQPEKLNHRLHLRELSWDYIVIDEASMISLVSIIFPLYYKTEAKFIIAGDPFQIQPIMSVSDWKDENIYTMVELNNFKNPTTIPHKYKVVNLPKQYRSIPSIGNLFSHFTYDGILENHRKTESQRPLKIDGLTVKDINVVKFPVSPFNSIYKANKLNQRSNYHIYSALFTYEFAKYISDQINANHKENYKIGIICPYKAQASLVNKLFASTSFANKYVDIQIGTIHGFQGDECDIVIALFNPPSYITESSEMFLNKQNILNVAISRSRDYLFILMPDERTENVFKLRKINQIIRLVNEHSEDNSTFIHAHDVEKVIFGDGQFILNNSFATTHQSVNVYAESEKRYEIRCEETAIDIQISMPRTK